jgi:hypothetical protein
LKSILFSQKVAVSMLLTLALYHGHSMAQETFWLTIIAAPYKAPKEIYPHLENPMDKTGDVSAITIKDKKIIFNGEWCNYDIEKTKPFVIDRTLSDAIDDSGGKNKFNQFMSAKLKTDISKWTQEYFILRSEKYLDNSACQLLQSSSIYRTNTDLIIWDSVFFYKFSLGKEFKY